MNRVLFKISYGTIWLITLLPLPVLYIISDILYIFAYYIIRYRKKVVFTNLKNAFPLKTKKEIIKIAKGYYLHLCDSLFIETVAMIHMNKEEFKKRYVFKNIEVLEDLYNKGKSICAVFGHYGNWDWSTTLPLYTKYNVYGIYMPIKNPQIDVLVNKLRSKFGAKMIHKQSAARAILNLSQTNEKFITYFIGDQTPSKHEIHYWTKFLNQDTAVFLGTEKIAKKTNQAVVYFDIKKIKRGYYEVEFIKLFENPKETKDFKITESHLRYLEKKIIEKPEFWLWSHRRWKHKKPETEKH